MDEATYIALSEAHMASFFRMAYSILRNRSDAEDAVQQALMNAWRTREKARDGSERAWVTRILINECYDILRARRRAVPMERLPEGETPFHSSADSGLYDAIQSLPDSLRLPFLLKYMEGMTEKETAAALRLPPGSVKHRLFRARKALQKILNEEVAL